MTAIDPPPPADNRDDESVLGGADAVVKTTGVTGRGTDPEGMTSTDGPPAARVSPGGGFGATTWIVVAAVLLAALAYAGGAFR
ncbi:MAG: hypothetical protein NVS4B3_20530 [Gemmatimonadaceae bacterium]